MFDDYLRDRFALSRAAGAPVSLRSPEDDESESALQRPMGR